MPIMAIYRRDDVSAELYAKFRAAAPLQTTPLGALAHVHGKVDSGFISVDVWEDAAAMERYIREVLIPATEALGIAFERPEVIEVETFLTTPAAEKFVVPFERAAANA